MTTTAVHVKPISSRRVRPKIGRTQIRAVDVIAASAMVLRPIIVSVAIIIAAVTWASPSHADTAASSTPVTSAR